MRFSDILPTPGEPYSPPIFNDSSILPVVLLPEGGDEDSPVASSVKQILSASVALREYYILNTGATIVRLFFGGDAETWQDNLATPFILAPNRLCSSQLPTCMLPIFAWTEGAGGEVTIGFFT